MRWHAKRDLVQPGACQKRDRAVRPSGQDQGHRPGPECLGKTGCDGRCRAEFKSGFSRRHVTDQRVESRPFLGGEDGGHGIGVAGIAAQPVNGLGREGDQPAMCQNIDATRHRLAGDGKAVCHDMVARCRHGVSGLAGSGGFSAAGASSPSKFASSCIAFRIACWPHRGHLRHINASQFRPRERPECADGSPARHHQRS